MFHRLLGQWGLSKNQQIKEDTFGHPVAYELLKQQNIDGIKALFKDIPDAYSQRYFFSLAFSRRLPVELLHQWVEREPYNGSAHLVLGARLLKVAWQARGYGRGHEVTPERWQNFYRLLNQTSEVLHMAAELNQKDPTPWVYLIMVAIYSANEKEMVEAYFNEVVKREPENWPGHMHRLIGLSQKYGGSHKQMFEFVEQTRDKIASDSLLNCLVFKAHAEYWRHKAHFDEDQKAADSHSNNPQVIEQCLSVYSQTLENKTYDPYYDLFARINGAGLMYILRQRKPLLRELKQLSGQLEDTHWDWLGAGWELWYAHLFARWE